MLKLADNPPMVNPPGCPVAEIAGPWWVAHTRSRNEKALAWFLHERAIAYFLPLRQSVRVRKGRRFQALVPLFGGYLFFSGDEQQRHTALTSNRVAQVLAVVDQQGLVQQLGQIQRALAHGRRLDPHPYMQRGTRCRVAAGPLRGMEGVVMRRKGLTKLILQVDVLGQAAALEIESDLLEAV